MIIVSLHCSISESIILRASPPMFTCPSCLGVCWITRSSPDLYLFCPFRFRKTRVYEILNVVQRVFGNAVLCYVFNGMTTRLQKHYFQISGNAQKLERVLYAQLREF